MISSCCDIDIYVQVYVRVSSYDNSYICYTAYGHSVDAAQQQQNVNWE